MRHRTRQPRRAVAAAATVQLSTGTGGADDVPAAALPTAPGRSL